MSELAEQVRNEIARTGPQLPPERDPFGEDLEALLSYLAEYHPWLNDERRLHNRATVAQVSRVIREVIKAAQRHTVRQPEPP
jgi:hypothetical protein